MHPPLPLPIVIYAIVIKDPNQYLNMMNIVQTFEGETMVEQRMVPTYDTSFDKRIVCGFVKGNFIASKMHRFCDDVANCAGIAPNAADYI